LFDAAAVGFELAFGIGVEDVGEVADIALGFEFVEVEGEEGEGEKKVNEG